MERGTTSGQTRARISAFTIEISHFVQLALGGPNGKTVLMIHSHLSIVITRVKRVGLWHSRKKEASVSLHWGESISQLTNKGRQEDTYKDKNQLNAVAVNSLHYNIRNNKQRIFSSTFPPFVLYRTTLK